MKQNKYQEGDQVYLTAYLKKEQGSFYVCKGKIQRTPGFNNRTTYKIRVFEVADSPVGGSPVCHQARLLGLVCAKREEELTKDLPSFMQPVGWIRDLDGIHKKRKKR